MFLSVESRVLLQLQQYNMLPLIVSELQSVLTWPSAWEHNSITPLMYYTKTAWGFLWNYIIWWQKWHISEQMPVTELFRVQELITLRASPAKMIVPIFAILKLKWFVVKWFQCLLAWSKHSWLLSFKDIMASIWSHPLKETAPKNLIELS
jgi:hypothetical protein